MIKSSLKFVSLNTPIGEDGEMELGDTLGEEQEEFCSVEDSIYHQELAEELRQAMNDNLTLQQRQVLLFRFGFECNVHTLEETGKEIGVTRERVRQIEVNSLRKLRSCRWARMRYLEFRQEHGRNATSSSIHGENARHKEEQEKDYNWGTRLVEQYGGIDGYIKHMREEQEKILKKMQLKLG